MGRAQQMLMEAWADGLKQGQPWPSAARLGSLPPAFGWGAPGQCRLRSRCTDDARARRPGPRGSRPGARCSGLDTGGEGRSPGTAASPLRNGSDNPIFDTIRQTYLALSRQAARHGRGDRGLDDETARRSCGSRPQSFVDAMSPSNFALTNPQVLKRTIETTRREFAQGPRQHARTTLRAGQLTQTKAGAFEVGRNLATTPGKVDQGDAALPADPVHADDRRGAGNAARDLPAVDQPLLHPRPHAREKLRQMVRRPGHHPVHGQLEIGRREHRRRRRSTIMSLKGQVDAIDTVRDLLGVEGVHAIGYCVAGTTLAATLGLSPRARASRTRSSRRPSSPRRSTSRRPGDLKLFTRRRDDGAAGRADRATRAISTGATWPRPSTCCAAATSSGTMSSTITCWARSRRRSTCCTGISDTTNLPASWHRDYLETLYKGNKLIEKGGISVAGVADRHRQGRRRRPTSRPAARTISRPPESVWKIMDHFSGPKRSCSPAPGHIAGVVNPPAAQKYQYWVNDRPAHDPRESFIEGASEHKGSWWPDWVEWLKGSNPRR